MTTLALAELRRRAEEYAATLRPGDEVHDFDQEHIEAFRHLLPEALARRGLLLHTHYESSPTVWRVEFAPRPHEWDGPNTARHRAHCLRCGVGAYFSIREGFDGGCIDAEPETVEAPAMTIQELHDLDPDNRFQGRNQQ